MKRHIFLIALLSGLLVALSACAITPPVHVAVNTMAANNEPIRQKYILLPSDKAIMANSLEYQEFSGYLEDAFSSYRMTRVDDIRKAEIVILVAYGIGEPKEQVHSYEMPVYGQTGVSSASTFGAVNTFGNYATYSGTTSYTPTYGVTGYVPHVESFTTYGRYLVMTAFDRGKQHRELWHAIVSSRGSSSDLRAIFPVMVVALRPYIWKSTGNDVVSDISFDDESVIAIRTRVQRGKLP